MLTKKLEGLKISLLDETAVEDFSFHGDKVSATLGTKDGPLCAPIFNMAVTGTDSIRIIGRGFVIDLHNIRITENEVQAIRNGRPSVYKVMGKTQPS